MLLKRMSYNPLGNHYNKRHLIECTLHNQTHQRPRWQVLLLLLRGAGAGAGASGAVSGVKTVRIAPKQEPVLAAKPIRPMPTATSSLNTLRTSRHPSILPAHTSHMPVVLPINGIRYAPLLPNYAARTATPIVPAPPPPKIRVTVHVNGSLKGGMALMLPESFDAFFSIAKAKLNFEHSFKRVFTRSGGEITGLDEMCPDDTLWLSKGEDFLTPR